MPTVTEYAQYFSEKEKALREKKKKHNDKKEKDTHTHTDDAGSPERVRVVLGHPEEDR